MSWRCAYTPAIGDIVRILPGENIRPQSYDRLTGELGIIISLEKIGQWCEIKASVLIEGDIVEVWYPDLFHVR